jgi:hypothetical protein
VNDCATDVNADHVSLFRQAYNISRILKLAQTVCRNSCKFFSREIVMKPSRTRHSLSLAAIAAAAIITELSWAGAALASQGPGGGLGSASHLTQVAMAIIVYGASALVVSAGLIGAARKQR